MKSSYNHNAYYKSFQDFEPVVLTKRNNNSSSNNNKSKSNIHINSKNNIDTDDIITIPKYTTEQINTIRDARTAQNLTQKQLANKISSTLADDFITNIENGKTSFNAKTYNTILRTLKITNKMN